MPLETSLVPGLDVGSLFFAEDEQSGIRHLRGRVLHVKSFALPEV